MTPASTSPERSSDPTPEVATTAVAVASRPSTATPHSPNPDHELVELDLGVTGMTCTACAARIERKLNRTDGVHANVNYALGRASVRFDPASIGPDEIVRAIEGVGYGATPRVPAGEPGDDRGPELEEHRVADLRRRLLVTAPLAVAVSLVSMVPSLQFDRWVWPVGVAATVALVYGGWPFHVAAVRNLRHHSTTMDTLVSLGTVTALVWSWWAITLGGGGQPWMRMGWSWSLGSASHAAPGMAGMPGMTVTSPEPYFEVTATVIVFLLLGRLLEARATRQAGSALRGLAELAVRDVDVVRPDGAVETVPLSQLLPGQRFLVRPGARVATDGVVVDGRSAVDTSMITGESVPVDVRAGDNVIGGTVNVDGALTVRALRIGRDTQLAQITQLVEQAQTHKAAVQRLADRVAAVFVPVVITLAIATLAFWLLRGWPAGRAVAAAVSVLIIACPCALGLATPTALLVGSTRGAQLGLLVSGPQALEQSERIDTVVFDKTGTITTGRMRVAAVTALGGWQSDPLLRMAAAVEAGSEHPIARAIVRAAEHEEADALPVVRDFRSDGGLGVSATVVLDGAEHRVRLGRRSWLAGPDTPADAAPEAHPETDIRTEVVIELDGQLAGTIGLEDELRTDAATAIASLRARGLRTLLLSGDRDAVARQVGERVGIDEVIADVLPAGKLDVINRLRAEGRSVAMVGDGVNDAAALAAADLGIAMAAGTDVARAAAHLTVVGEQLAKVPEALALARATMRTIKANLFWAFAYNVAALPLAASGRLNPMVAGAAMSASSVFVVTNSLRLRRFGRS